MLEPFKQNKSLTLLVSLMLLILFFPFFETSRLAQILFIFFYTTMLLSGVYAISFDVRYIAIGLLLVAPIAVAQWSNIILNSPAIDFLERICTTIFMAYTLVALLERVFRARRVGLDEIYASICAFILIGMVFAYIYLLMEAVVPGSFKFPYARNPYDAAPFLFFSFSALAGGGSDVIAIAPFARSLALIEVLIGVIYVAVLIGRLISASFINDPTDDTEITERRARQKALREILSQPVFLKNQPMGVIIAGVMFNFVTSAMMIHLHLPFFLDSWGTSMAVIFGGWWAGAATAALYHLLIGVTHWGWSSWIWVFCSLLIAGITRFFCRQGWISITKPYHLIGAGIVTGLLNAALAQTLILIAKLPPYESTMPVYSFFLKATRTPALAAMAEKMFVEIADKTVSIILAAVAVFLLYELLETYKEKLEARHK